MMKTKKIVTNSSKELADALGLTSSDALEIEIRSALNHKIVEIVTKKKLTHAQVATLAKTSRTRITAIMNYNSKDVSADLMLRILGALGLQAEIHFKKAA